MNDYPSSNEMATRLERLREARVINPPEAKSLAGMIREDPPSPPAARAAQPACWSPRLPRPHRSEADAAREERACLFTQSCKVPARYRVRRERSGQEALVYAALCGHVGKGNGAIVLLCGLPGTGKTQMACEAVLEFCRAGNQGLYVRAADFLEDIKATFDGQGKTHQVLAKYAKPKLLAIDEWHRRGKGEWAGQQLWNLVDRRYAELRPTIIISNGTPDELSHTFDGAMWDRMNEDGGAIECDWQSHRERQ